MNKILITKSLFLKYLSCPTLGWFEANSANKKPLSSYEELQATEGREIGVLARSLFKNGVLIEANSNELAAKQTLIHMQDAGVAAVFEATFIAGGFVTKADILVREKNQWKLIEVKSSLHNPKKPVKPEHVDDIAYTTYVAANSNLNISSIEIMRLSKGYRLGSPVTDLFVSLDCSEVVQKRAGEFAVLSERILEDIQSQEKPKPFLNTTCKHCEHFKVDCVGVDLSHPTTELPRITDKKLSLLNECEIFETQDIPDNFELTPPQARVVSAVKSKGPIQDVRQLPNLLKKVSWPCYYLDFESILIALPIYPNIAPHQVVLTQYSLHVRTSSEADVQHFEYLAPHNKDSRRELLVELLARLGTVGSIVVYSDYEEIQLKSLAKTFPDLGPQIDAIIIRLFDLQEVFTACYYHPDFCGSTSIKKVLPVLVPELSYKGLDIGEGGEAVAQFVKMAKGQCTETEVTKIRLDLLKYCHLDTLAMLKLHEVVNRFNT